jgi:SRSO17 transposase
MEVIIAWQQEFKSLVKRIFPRFARSQSRKQASQYLQGLLSQVERKNGWQLAESLGQSTPYNIEQFLYRAKWSADEVRDDLRAYVVEHLGDPGAVLVIDETGFLKKGSHSVGVQVQYCGTVGRVTNCQIGVFLAYASVKGQSLLDRALYLPESWTNDRERCRKAGVPDTVGFATKPELARQMIARALTAQVPAAWVTGDSVYGGHYPLRNWLEGYPIGYVLAVSPKDTLLNLRRWPQRVSTWLADLPTEGWSRLSAGEGSQGPREYDWLRLPLADPKTPGWKRWLLFRRSLSDPTEVTPYICFAPADTPLETLVQVAGTRWTVESCFETTKQEVGLDEYEVRTYQGWYRHITLACLAHAFLAVLRAKGLDPLVEAEKAEAEKKTKPQPSSLTTFKARRGLISP